jgi:predicted lipoprotein with Yx(FWY)xxD motif
MTHHADADATPGRRAMHTTARFKGLARPGTAVAAVVVVALALSACGSSSPSSTTAAGTGNSGTAAAASSGTSASTATVKTTDASGFGTILVNNAGMALYTYGPNNGATVNMCTGACLQAWPALTVPAGTTPTLASGVSGTLATAKQSDGTLQVTYNGMLLYTFVSDGSPGQVTGNGVAKFSVAKVSSATPATAPVTSAPSSGGNQY